MQELLFLHSAHHLMFIDISMKFCENAWTVFKLQSGHEYVTESKGKNSKSINARVMVLVLCMSSNVDWYLYEVPNRLLE